MADKKTTKKTAQTVRERSKVAADHPKTKSRSVRQTARSITKPVAAATKNLKRVAKPLRPLAVPFRLRPVRFVGRVLANILLINYFWSSIRELRQVAWPGRKETTKLTLAVFTFAIIFGAIIAITDYGLDKLFRKLLVS